MIKNKLNLGDPELLKLALFALALTALLLTGCERQEDNVYHPTDSITTAQCAHDVDSWFMDKTYNIEYRITSNHLYMLDEIFGWIKAPGGNYNFDNVCMVLYTTAGICRINPIVGTWDSTETCRL
jgi:hypothetical protein